MAPPAPDATQSPAPTATADDTETAADAAADFPRTIQVPAGRDLPATEVTVPAEPARVAALTYETAELVADLGAQERLVMVQEAMANPAISDHAEAMAEIEQHAATEGSIDVEAVIAAQPDLVLLSDRRGLQEGIGQILGEAGIPVLVLPNNWATVADLASNIELVGQALGTDEEAAALAERGRRVLTIDLDPQANASSSVGYPRADIELGTYELLLGEAKWGAVTERHLRTLRRRAALVEAELGGAAAVHLALFTGRGEADEAVREEAAAGRVLLFTADALRKE